MDRPVMSSGPHIHSGADSRRIMLDVIVALLPATVAAVLLFGWKALEIVAVCVVSAVLAEALFNVLAKKKQTVGDLSAVVTGLLLALNLSTYVELWQCAVGAVFAIVLVKCLFGGIGKNFANPAITARVFMLLAFATVGGGAAPSPLFKTTADAVSSATPLALIAERNAEALPGLGAMFLGLRGGAVGETCILALLLGFGYLLARRVIRWQIPVIFIGTVFVLSLIATGSFSLALYEILGGGLFLGAIFMATDYSSTPITLRAKLLFALGCGLITFAVRQFFSYPEGVSFSILFMNILSPVLEKITRRKPLGGV
ncbi:MAG: RnfABCDGE type electron transport complex subunit D [Oscillospiraceae bacterium]|nr:RnfABCDGE type electron transport complex subunit D [Oscillospiraceae bacterium]